MKLFRAVLFLVLFLFSNNYAQDFWERTNELDSLAIISLAINSNGAIFAGTNSEGVLRSTNNGDSWSNLGFTNYRIRSMDISPSEEILIATDDNFAGGGVYRSTNGGTDWDTLDLLDDALTSIAINSSGNIFIGTNSTGVYRSTDSGQSWAQINQGLITNNGQNPTSIIVNTIGHIFAGTVFGGVFRSTDNGDNWDQINQGLTTIYILSLAVNSNGDIFAGTAAGGAFRSTDNGDNWVQINQGLTPGQGYYVYSFVINSYGDIFAGTANGIYRSADNGDNWVQINQGLTNLGVLSLAINSNDDIYAGTTDGVFRTIPSANIKVFLQGPYAAGLMNTTLRTNGYLPLTQPYSAAPFSYSGTETVASIPADVVDWVLLEIRSDETTVESKRAAFLMSDGSVVDLDGVSTVKFPGVTPGDYYTVIRHRNHLAVMTANPVTLSFSPLLYDFSSSQTQAYGTNAMKDLGGGFFGLYTGDGNRDGFVTSTDFNIFNPKFTSAASGYEYSDWNLDGLVTSTDFNFFNPNFTTAKQTFVP